MTCSRVLCLAVAAWFAADVVAQESPSADAKIVLRSGKLLASVTQGGRVPLHVDPLEHALLSQHAWPLNLAALWDAANNEEKYGDWQELEANEDGAFAGRELSRGYLAFDLNIQEPGAYLLSASGHGAALVNGQPRAGNPYGSWYQVPVELSKGPNQLLFTVARGRFRGSLTKIEKPIFLADGDTTLPDWLRGTDKPLWAAIPVVNATRETQSPVIETRIGDLSAVCSNVVSIVPMAIRKVGFLIQAEAIPDSESLEVLVRLLDGDEQANVLDERKIQVSIRDPTEKHRRTFKSAINGSVQYFGVVPPSSGKEQATRSTTLDGPKPGLVLTLHGASVEGMGQANVYGHKPDMFVIAPTNRRPFGFDWEDWGRRDAIEVLEIAQEEFETDPRRTYLTGHSMGGHGAWQVGATYPDRFAAIGPSAGWVSFWSYGGHRPGADDAMGQMLRRAANGSDTLLMRDNYVRQGVYILHGDADDNVPVSEVRSMRTALAEFHPDFAYYEQPGAGHWWGNRCCDWPPMFEFFRRHQRPVLEEVAVIDFTTVNPGVSSQCDWVTIADQIVPLAPSHVRLRLDRNQNKLLGSTTNVALLALDLEAACPASANDDPPEDEPTPGNDKSPEQIAVTLDGQALTLKRQLHWLRRANAVTDGDDHSDQPSWTSVESPSRRQKGPHRYGLFKSAFDHHAILVYGTSGTDEENTWALAKARYDAEQFWYRGNGSFDVIPDTRFVAQSTVDRSVILYGNAETNGAWAQLLADCPVEVTRTSVAVGDRRLVGDDLFALFVFPRPDCDTALVGVVSGTGIEGVRSTNFLRYFVSGVAYPDLLVGKHRFLRQENSGVQAAGFFDSRWGLDSADMVFGAD